MKEGKERELGVGTSGTSLLLTMSSRVHYIFTIEGSVQQSDQMLLMADHYC